MTGMQDHNNKVFDKENIKLVFLPPNYTSKIQPMKMGLLILPKKMIASFQATDALLQILDHVESQKITLLNVILWIQNSISLVTVETIKNWWLKATFCDTESLDLDG
ncbi:hypothetical protein NGRA_1032 [Nosema granulosis]|uniref:DDE-1 domain-containing protein n=1 Tax=Nosema granulosis TaxID=83296 RepID=A0A9P6GZ69_9MICR|nr:hypothetical protein NGRA_1032 [Nosema granulosis]